ncbi:NADH-quinone oxidoreductase subunit J [Shewanella hanedai]|uniref:NADH-quinone oxidoreductase subunit J n=1 Tax=Shewanella hanedai TaxID=25 RepID=A0A553JME6_SHEHA|nr:NADH-quinone oxidoreductase subunit J [Shewanella hanedai]TRY13626.1 NADH-quinone oxidoreductase subunit J [Shewanella hanedai]GGI97881.1 NADH-quinone oxidoreductase subunit J [Shewanella hanedai]
MIEAIFMITAIVCLISALLTVTAHNAVHALLYLVTMMIAIALIFFLFGSPFAAALQIIVYAGAVMVLFVFVTMMLHQGEKSNLDEKALFSLKNAKGPLLLATILIAELLMISVQPLEMNSSLVPLSAISNEAEQDSAQRDNTSQPNSVKSLAIQLYGPYRLLVIIAAMLLLSALIAAIHIARKTPKHVDVDLSPEETQLANKQQKANS